MKMVSTDANSPRSKGLRVKRPLTAVGPTHDAVSELHENCFGSAHRVELRRRACAQFVHWVRPIYALKINDPLKGVNWRFDGGGDR